MSHPDAIAIVSIRACEMLNVRGEPAVEAEVILADGSSGRAAVPSGMSTGVHEACELLDGDPGRYWGKGVLKAIANVHDVIAPALAGMPAGDQAAIDRRLLELDGTANKSRLGANAILAVSLAVAYAAAASRKLPLYRYLGGDGPLLLPVPMFDILSGGIHVKDCVDFQEFIVVPAGFPSCRDAVRAGAEIHRALFQVFRRQGYAIRDGENLAPPLPSNRAGVEALLAAIELAGYHAGRDCFIYIDAAASHLYRDGVYTLGRENRRLSTARMIDLWAAWVADYPIVAIEDGLAEDDWDGWQALARRLGDRVELIGDDFFCTNPERIRRGVQLSAANGAIIKPNQIGTLTETLEAIGLLRAAGWVPVMSGRSGETEDSAIVDLAVAQGTGQKKFGPPWSTNITKINRLLRIEQEDTNVHFAGLDAFRMLRADS